MLLITVKYFLDMKKWLKILLGTIGVLTILIIGILFYALSAIDTTPYFETDYYAHSIANIDKSFEEVKTENAILKAGFAKGSITPQIVEGKEEPQKGKFNRINLSGFGDGAFATTAHDTLYVKAMALEVGNNQVVLVGADVLMIPEELTTKVAAKLKANNIPLTREQIYFGATHTHSSIGNMVPGFVGKKFGGEYQPELMKWLTEQFYQAIIAALNDKKPAKIGSKFIHVPGLIQNRIIGETGRLNDRLTMVSVKQDSAKQAVIGVFGAHATILGSWNDKFSGGYPGYFQRKLESTDIDMAMFFAGAVGSHTNKSQGDKFEKAQYMGEALADSALVALAKIDYVASVELTTLASKIERPKLQPIYISSGLRLSPSVGEKLIPPVQSIYLQAFKIDNLVWQSMPYELSGEFAIDLQNALELEGYNSVITSFNGQYLGYIVPSKYYYFDTYEARLMGWYGPSMGDYLMELNYKVANGLTGLRL